MEGVIIINIEIKNRSRLKEFSDNLFSRLEDMMFFIIQKLPNKITPPFLLEWLNKYLDKRIMALQQQNIKQTWKQMYLEDAVSNIRQKDIEKAQIRD